MADALTTITRLNPSLSELRILFAAGWRVLDKQAVEVTLLHRDYRRGGGTAVAYVLGREDGDGMEES